MGFQSLWGDLEKYSFAFLQAYEVSYPLKKVLIPQLHMGNNFDSLLFTFNLWNFDLK